MPGADCGTTNYKALDNPETTAMNFHLNSHKWLLFNWNIEFMGTVKDLDKKDIRIGSEEGEGSIHTMLSQIAF